MIKETCSCGSTFEYIPTGYNPVKEADAAKEWRRNHMHDWNSHMQGVMVDAFEKSQTVAPQAPRVQPGAVAFVKDENWYTENKHWVWGEDGRVWIADRDQPSDFAEWSKRWPKPE